MRHSTGSNRKTVVAEKDRRVMAMSFGKIEAGCFCEGRLALRMP